MRQAQGHVGRADQAEGGPPAVVEGRGQGEPAQPPDQHGDGQDAEGRAAARGRDEVGGQGEDGRHDGARADAGQGPQKEEEQEPGAAVGQGQGSHGRRAAEKGPGRADAEPDRAAVGEDA